MSDHRTAGTLRTLNAAQALKLLVSVSSAAEAVSAVAGGADFVDAKDPLSGALGAVSPDVLRAIHAAVAGARPVTAAIGDAAERDDDCAAKAASFTVAGASLVKIGFARVADAGRVEALLGAAVRGADAGMAGRGLRSAVDRRFGVVAVAYADADCVGSLAPDALVEISARAGAVGVLLDTADKSGPGLSRLIGLDALAAWVSRAHAAGLFVALAGKLTIDDVAFVRAAGADIAGVRGAACNGGRAGRVSAAKVAILRAACGSDLLAAGVTCAAPV
jgi:(5-formylfuran-3-yl)methyl phosphate synthase